MTAPLSMAETVYYRGRVVMEDGSRPPSSVAIERVCLFARPQQETQTSRKTGTYILRAEADFFGRLTVMTPSGTAVLRERQCLVRASLKGYVSSVIDLADRRLVGNQQLPDLRLSRKAAENFQVEFDSLPPAVEKSWDRAMTATQDKNWSEAERLLREVMAKVPKFASGWSALGLACLGQKKSAAAREAFEKALAADPKRLLARLMMIRADAQGKDWKTALADADALIKADPRHRYVEAYLLKAVAQGNLGDLDAAEASAREAIRLDARKQLPKAQVVLTAILDTRRELETKPKAEAAAAQSRIGYEAEEVDAEPPGDGEAWVPGGYEALGKLAGVTDASYAGFFSAFTRAIVAGTSGWNQEAVPDYLEAMRTLMASSGELAGLGEPRETGTLVTMSLADAARRAKTGRILELLGWRAVEREGKVRVEPGDTVADRTRQRAPAAFGLDEIEMQEALEAGRTVQFEVRNEDARLIGGAAWFSLVKGVAPFPGGIADLFTRDLRFARTYAGLGSMPPEAATALLKSVGLRTLVTRDSDALALFGADVKMDGERVVAPGDEAAWQALAGAPAKDVGGFLKALFDKDGGRLAAFYSAMGRADRAHQRLFAGDAKTAARYYAWYRDSEELKWGVGRPVNAWRAMWLREAPLTASGGVAYPGGREAWGKGADEAVLTGSETVEALIPLAQAAKARGRDFDAESVRIVSRRYADWRFLFPYFERLRGLGAGEFQALERFTDQMIALPPARQNAAMGVWYSLAELAALASKAGSIDDAAAARAFRRASEQAAPMEVLREMAGGDDADRELPRLLGLKGERRAAFERMRAMQKAPRMDGSLTALTAAVYAAWLSPDTLVVEEDPLLAARHQFTADMYLQRAALFKPCRLIPAADSRDGGASLAGGFMNIGELAGELPRTGSGSPAAGVRTAEPAAGVVAAAPAEPVDAVFRVSGRLVEVHATVRDSHGRYADDLGQDEFEVLEEGQPRTVAAFEPRSSRVYCALLLDTTGSMQNAIAALKSAAFALVDDLRPNDQAAVYAFNQTVRQLSPFTEAKGAAKRAVLKTRAFGETALYDAVVRVIQDLSAHAGKKVIVVFTDGEDNRSTLTTDLAIRKAKGAGIPVYTIAQGDALNKPELLKHLSAMSKATGGLAYKIREPREIRAVFESVSEDLTHGYLLAFRPSGGEGHAWRNISVVLKNPKKRTVRAREGFYSE